MSLSTACQPLGVHELSGGPFQAKWDALKTALGAAKQRPFDQQAAVAWDAVFSPRGVGTDRHCAVCYREPEARHLQAINQLAPDEDWWCDDCLAFDQLGRDLARKHAYLSVAVGPDVVSDGPWQNLLHQLTGWWYDLHGAPPQAAGAWVYALNTTDFLETGAHGFRFVATHTPLARPEDLGRWKEKAKTSPPPIEEEPPRPGETIRTFESLARASHGIPRIGILRMDVDNLGRIFGSYIQQPSLARISAASAAMSLFFDGWLNVICAEVEAERPHSLYVIYAGGDDLFVVGPWDLMPTLAERIRADLATYVNHNPHITISAGITVEDAHYPLYQAADHALQALDDGAKGDWHTLDRQPKEKNAISLLGQVIGWEDGWPLVTAQCSAMLDLLDEGMPKALIQTIQQVHAQYAEGQRHALRAGRLERGQLYYGRWLWMQAYSLTRLAARSQNVRDAQNRIRRLQEAILTPETVHLAGLAARWADYLVRKRQGEE